MTYWQDYADVGEPWNGFNLFLLPFQINNKGYLVNLNISINYKQIFFNSKLQ